jgi:hypothetical protein
MTMETSQEHILAERLEDKAKGQHSKNAIFVFFVFALFLNI